MKHVDFKYFIKAIDSFTAWERRVILRMLKRPKECPKSTLKFFKLLEKERFTSGRYCPHCHRRHVVRIGRAANGAQRFKCSHCSKTFNAATGSIFARCIKPEKWWTYMQCIVDHLPLRKAAKRCEIALSTSFLMRHKIMDILRKGTESNTVGGVVEVDETFFELSFKGNHQNEERFKMPRKAHVRGHSSSQRGNSLEKVCVITGVARMGSTISVVSNLGGASAKDVKDAIGSKIEDGTILCSDGTSIYDRISQERNFGLVKIRGGKKKKGLYHIQNINSFHSSLKNFMVPFRGVATKYLPNYLAWHSTLVYAKSLADDVVGIVSKAVLRSTVGTKSREVNVRHPVPITSSRQKGNLDRIFEGIRRKAAMARSKLKRPRRKAPASSKLVPQPL